MGNPYDVKLKHHGLDTSWMDYAACKGRGPVMFFREDSRSVAAKRDVLEAVELCHSCPAEADCLSYALTAQMVGIWGGKTTRERERLLRARGRRRGTGTV